MPRTSRSMRITCNLFVLVALTSAGCSFDPEKTVTIEITGKLSEDDRQEIGEKLKTMTDNGNHQMQTTYSGNKTTIKLQPVSDPQAFAEKIEFGEVTAVEGRTVKVSVKAE